LTSGYRDAIVVLMKKEQQFTPEGMGVMPRAKDDRKTKDANLALERLRLIMEETPLEYLADFDLVQAQELAHDIIESIARERRNRG
jgi:hypothetical protein